MLYKRLVIKFCMFSIMFGMSLGSYAGIIKSDGKIIGTSYAPNAPIFSETGYYYTLVAPNDGVSINAQVQSKKLYYITSDCTGDAYIANEDVLHSDSSGIAKPLPSGFVSGGNVFVGYSDVNTKSLFYVPLSSKFSQLKSLSYRENNKVLTASINTLPGEYVLHFGNYVTEKITWNDTSEQIAMKITSGIPIIVAVHVNKSTNTGSTSFVSLRIMYQTALENSDNNFTVTDSSGRSVGDLGKVEMMKTLPGTCVLQKNNNFDILNRPLTKVLQNNPSITGISDMDFSQPITYEISFP